MKGYLVLLSLFIISFEQVILSSISLKRKRNWFFHCLLLPVEDIKWQVWNNASQSPMEYLSNWPLDLYQIGKWLIKRINTYTFNYWSCFGFEMVTIVTNFDLKKKNTWLRFCIVNLVVACASTIILVLLWLHKLWLDDKLPRTKWSWEEGMTLLGALPCVSSTILISACCWWTDKKIVHITITREYSFELFILCLCWILSMDVDFFAISYK